PSALAGRVAGRRPGRAPGLVRDRPSADARPDAAAAPGQCGFRRGPDAGGSGRDAHRLAGHRPGLSVALSARRPVRGSEPGLSRMRAVEPSPGVAGLEWGDPSRPVDLVFLHANGFNARTMRTLLAPMG